MKGSELKLYLGNDIVAMATNVTFELSQDVVECTPLPGSVDDDGWVHYQRGTQSWGTSCDGIYTVYFNTILSAVISGNNSFNAKLSMTNCDITGTVHLSEVSMVSQRKSVTKFTCKFECDGKPVCS